MGQSSCNISSWVRQAPQGQREFRQAAHLVLMAITQDADLQKSMIMKGGVLMALLYQSNRFTTDLDFSSTLLPKEFALSSFEQRLQGSLAEAVADSEYDLDCRIQRCRIQPAAPTASFPSVDISIGYAYKGTAKHKRLLLGQSPSKLDIDFSLNEKVIHVEDLDLGEGAKLKAYDMTDLVAEKLRSLLQQSTRNRYRRQDTFDLRLLIEAGIEPAQCTQILETLKAKAEARKITPTPLCFDDQELRRRAHRDYHTLQQEILDPLPDFDESFEIVRSFYRSLPW